MFYKRTIRNYVILTVYIDDILLTSNDTTGISETKEYLKTHFVTKDTKKTQLLSQRKYVLNLLQETRLLDCKPKNTPINQNPTFLDSSSELLENVCRQRRLIEKLIYLTVIRLNISCVLGLLSQFMNLC